MVSAFPDAASPDAGPADAGPDRLAGIVANRRWRWHDRPFPHVVADDVFQREVYLDMVAAFRSVQEGPAGFRRDMPGYDASSFQLTASMPPPLDLFVTRRWHDLMCGLFGVTGTGHVSGGLHHHEPGGLPGGVHNDLNPGWFPAAGSPDRVVLSDPVRCTYSSGDTTDPDLVPVQVVRAVALIFYLANPPWSPGDGGETGLYRRADDDIRRPAASVPPAGNSLVAFECTPFSFHGFLGASRRERNSLVLWTHRPAEEVEARWGRGVVVPWT